MRSKHAVIGGLMGALFMALVMGIARLFRVPLNLEMILGSFFTGGIGLGTWFLGLVLHLAGGAIFGLIYAFILEAWFQRSSWALGLALAIPHAVVAGVFLGLLPEIHPLVPQVFPPQGLFMVELGPGGVAGFILSHLVFGGIVGTMCARPRHEPRRRGERRPAPSSSRWRDLEA